MAVCDQLGDRNGRHIIPHGARLSIGAGRRNVDGNHAADFPADWYIQPNPVDRLDPILPDNPAKLKAQAEGKPLVYTPPLKEELTRQVEGAGKP